MGVNTTYTCDICGKEILEQREIFDLGFGEAVYSPYVFSGVYKERLIGISHTSCMRKFIEKLRTETTLEYKVK